MSKRIALITVLVVFFTGGDVFAKKKGESGGGSTITGTAVFDESLEMKLRGDTLGPYPYKTPNDGAFINKFDGILNLRTGDNRSLFLSFSPCDGCETPFDPPAVSGYKVGAVMQIVSLINVGPGEANAVLVRVFVDLDESTDWVVEWPQTATATGTDTDSDGQTDRWEVTALADALVTLTKRESTKGRRKVSSEVGVFYLPFKMTFTAD